MIGFLEHVRRNNVGQEVAANWPLYLFGLGVLLLVLRVLF